MGSLPALHDSMDTVKPTRIIGLTTPFIARKFWGTSANREIKEAMLSRSFLVVDLYVFDIAP